jgi:hypothetical protein
MRGSVLQHCAIAAATYNTTRAEVVKDTRRLALIAG